MGLPSRYHHQDTSKGFGGLSQKERRQPGAVTSPGGRPYQQWWGIPSPRRFRHFCRASELPLTPQQGSITPLCSTAGFAGTLGFTNSGSNDSSPDTHLHRETQNTDTLDTLPLPRAQAFHNIPKRREFVLLLQPGI